MMKSNKKNKRAPSAAAAAATVGNAHLPPQIVQAPRVGGVLRFQSSATISSSIDITWACLRNLFFTTITSSTANTIISAFRVSKIELFVPSSGASTTTAFANPVTIRIREGDGMVGEDKVMSTVVTSTAGAYLHRKFSKTTTDFGKWHFAAGITSGDIAFSIVALPGGSLVDLHFSWTGWATGSSVLPLTCGALSTGRIYRNCLDNTDAAGAIGGGLLLPAGVVGGTGIAFG